MTKIGHGLHSRCFVEVVGRDPLKPSITARTLRPLFTTTQTVFSKGYINLLKITVFVGSQGGLHGLKFCLPSSASSVVLATTSAPPGNHESASHRGSS